MFELDKSRVDTPIRIKQYKKDNPVSKNVCPLWVLSNTHFIGYGQIKFLYSNNRSELTTKFVLHCLVASLGNNKNCELLKRPNELYVHK